ncbi:hypothetical protein JTE90_027927 [Oedothorax gibbosus]|uniref:TGF-beta family profile domain-containing protein n=1 Tax=Oedothorax gibbosus TaxID=931172 RepID=A0AAV6VHM9_9ARAC|nr:hypothetical protein JTE90_027927 [Oedothorax gibbosus]
MWREIVSLFLLWILVGWNCVCDRSLDERQFLADIKELDSNRNVPALFKRTYKEWIEETRCINESLKSSEANIKHKGPLRFSMKARIAARSGKPLVKVELWVEFYNASKVSSSSSYEAVIRPTDSRIQSTNQTSSEKVISDKGRLLELSFNVTDIYYTSNLLGKKYVQFRINIHGSPKRYAKDLIEATNIKAFLIIHEFEEVCNDYLPVRHPGRYQRSLRDQSMFSRPGRSRHVLNRHKFQPQPTPRTMGDALHNMISMSFHAQNRLQGFLRQNLESKKTMKSHHRHPFQKPLKSTNPMVGALKSLQFPHPKHLNKRSSKPSPKSLHPNKSSSTTRTSCGLNDWYVSFDYIGWSSFVLAPSGVRARTCSGVCSFPMGKDINSTAHAHLQSFVYYFKGEKWPACCVPNDFEPLTMIMYDVTDQLLFIFKYPNMIATNCACL